MNARDLILVLAASLPVAGCSSNVVGADSGGDVADLVEASNNDVVGTDVSPVDAMDAIDAPQMTDATEIVDTPPADSGIQCRTNPTSFPTFDATCSTVNDCALVFHQTDCCGSLLALGINRSQMAAFQSAESTCDAMYPGCGCAPNGITLSNGMVTQFGETAIYAACVSGQCTSQVRASTPCGSSMCSPSQLCVPGCCGVDGCTPPPPACVDIPQSCVSTPSCGCFTSNPCPTGSCVTFDGQEVRCLCA